MIEINPLGENYSYIENCCQVMNHSYFNRTLHLLDHPLQKGKRLIGLGASAFWELWQRVEELDKETGRQRAKKSANVMSRLLVGLLYLRRHWTMQALAKRNDRLQ